MKSLLYLLGGIGTFITAIVSAIVLLKKYGPEINKIQVETAQGLVEMANANAQMSQTQADDLRRRNEILDNRLTELATQFGAQEERLKELERKAEMVDQLRMEVDRERAARKAERKEKERIAAENERLLARVEALEEELRNLKTQPTAERGQRGPQGDRGDVGPIGPIGHS
jgi:chromosome segregation ATPase